MAYIIVFIGSGIGGMLRHGVNVASAYLFGTGTPFGTIFVNAMGSFLTGMLVGIFALKGHGGENLRLFLATGIIGGFTTFSTFSLEAVTLYRRGEIGAAITYASGSVMVAVGALMLAQYLICRLV
jgi:fluoride exporter